MENQIKFERVRSGGIRVTAVVGEEFAATVASVLENLDTEDTGEFVKRLNWALGNEPIHRSRKHVILNTRRMLFAPIGVGHLLTRLVVEQMRIGTGANFVMNQSSFLIPHKSEIATFADLPLSDLGFSSDVPTKDFMTEEFCRQWSAENLRWGRIGLCHVSDPARFRLSHTNQSKGETLWFAAKRFEDNTGMLSVFQVLCDKHGQKWVATKPAPDGAIWDKGMRIVFRYYDTPHES